jgi:2,4-dienoyl-CoA reductase-like NADH-dependent reductase (Old Yellow Enzyme family)
VADKKLDKLLEPARIGHVLTRNRIIKPAAGLQFRKPDLCYPKPPVPLMDLPPEPDMSYSGAGANVPLAEAFKKVVSVPAITGDRFDPELGQKVLEEGKADFIAMNRRLHADSIVAALPMQPNNELSAALKRKAAEVHATGDCGNPGPIVNVISNG